MAEGRLRLRVALQRNGLPEHRFVLPVASGSSPTVSELLKLVSDLYMPLESEDWGLEDYVLELPNLDGTKSECLHFSPIRDVLKDDDQVVIRPLQDTDMKRRRLSGRHQISADGRRLVDGIPFGRPLLKTPRGRPAVHISPRKRRKVMTYRDEEEEEEQSPDKDMLLLTNGDHQDGSDDDDDSFHGGSDDDQDEHVGEGFDFDDEEEEEDDEQMQSLNEEDLTDELQALHEDQTETNDNELAQRRKPSDRRTSPPRPVAVDPQSALRAAFPSAPGHVVEMILTSAGGDVKAAYGTLLEGFKPGRSETATLAVVAGKEVAPPERKSQSDVSPKKTPAITGPQGDDDIDDDQESEGDGDDDPDGISDFVRRYDRQGLPPGTISTGTDMGSFNSKGSGNSEATSATLTGNKIIFRDEEDENQNENADTTSSSGASSDDSDSDSDSDDAGASSWDGPDSDDDDNAPAKRSRRESTSSSSGASSSSDDDDSGPEEEPIVSSESRKSGHAADVEISSDSDSSSDCSADDSDSSSSDSSDSDSSSDSDGETPGKSVKKNTAPTKPTQEPKQTPVPPGAGKEATKRRNERRRKAKKGGNNVAQQVLDKKAEFEARREALLAALADGGLEMGSSREQEISSTKKDASREKRKRGDADDSVAPDTTAHDEDTVDTATETPKEASTTLLTVDSTDSSAKRRRMDVGAGRRMLFSALGLRNPKTKEDENSVRDKLMKDVRPLTNARLEQENSQAMVTTEEDQAEEEDPDAWREKITYRAVECCQEDIELSEPPFPFVQRWDPQQQNTWYQGKGKKRGGRGKRAQRDQDHYYENQAGKKRKQAESFDWCDEEEYDDTYNGVEEEEEIAYLNYDDEEPSTGAQDPTAEASQFTDIDDLPSLPKDISSLPTLRAGDVKPGMVITWKKWSCSPATNWQPQVSDVTAIVARIDDEATGLEVCLAKRDRHLDGPQKQFDSLTGQRVYNRFEAPELDSDEEYEVEEDTGFRTMSFSELMDPRIVQQPLDTDTGDTQPAGTEPSKEQDQEREAHGESPPTSRKGTGVDVSQEQQVSSSKGSTKAASGSTEHQPGQGHPHLTHTPDIAISDESQDPLTNLPSSGYRGDLDTEMTVNVDVASDQPPDSTKPSSPPPQSSSNKETSSDPNFGDDDDVGASEVMTGTPHIIYPKLIQASAPASSVASGRQPDETMDMDMDGQGAGSLHASEEEIHEQEIEEEDEPEEEEMDYVAHGHVDGESTILGASHLPWSEGEMEETTDKSPELQQPPFPSTAPALMATDDLKSENKKSHKIIPSSPGWGSDESLESLNTVWCTARSRKTQSPSRAPISPIKPRKSIKNLEYEEAMRELDEMSAGDDDAPDSTVPDSYPHLPQSQDPKPSIIDINSQSQESRLTRATANKGRLSRAAAGTISPPPLSKRDPTTTATFQKTSNKSATIDNTKSKIPPGSQVVDLLSSSDAEAEDADEPMFTENYADDDADETYSPASLPKRINKALSQYQPRPGRPRDRQESFRGGKRGSSSRPAAAAATATATATAPVYSPYKPPPGLLAPGASAFGVLSSTPSLLRGRATGSSQGSVGSGGGGNGGGRRGKRKGSARF